MHKALSSEYSLFVSVFDISSMMIYTLLFPHALECEKLWMALRKTSHIATFSIILNLCLSRNRYTRRNWRRFHYGFRLPEDATGIVSHLGITRENAKHQLARVLLKLYKNEINGFCYYRNRRLTCNLL